MTWFVNCKNLFHPPNSSISLGVYRRPVYRLGPLPEVDILPVPVRSGLILWAQYISVASYLPLCLGLVTNHIPGHHEEEECPQSLSKKIKS